MPLPQVWTLAKHWYHDRMDSDFQGRTPEQITETFRQAGLTTIFWHP